MSQHRSQQSLEEQIRAVYEEYTLQETRVAMISDPENEHAWIQSDWTMPISA